LEWPYLFARDKSKPQELLNIFFIQVAEGAEFLNGNKGAPGFTQGFADLADEALGGMEGETGDN
jgi:hypothetical protein